MQIHQLKDLLKDSKVPFMVGFNRRYDQSIQEIKKSIKNGTIGTPQIVGITSRDPAPPDINYLKTSAPLVIAIAPVLEVLVRPRVFNFLLILSISLRKAVI